MVYAIVHILTELIADFMLFILSQPSIYFINLFNRKSINSNINKHKNANPCENITFKPQLPWFRFGPAICWRKKKNDSKPRSSIFRLNALVCRLSCIAITVSGFSPPPLERISSIGFNKQTRGRVWARNVFLVLGTFVVVGLRALSERDTNFAGNVYYNCGDPSPH